MKILLDGPVVLTTFRFDERVRLIVIDLSEWPNHSDPRVRDLPPHAKSLALLLSMEQDIRTVQ